MLVQEIMDYEKSNDERSQNMIKCLYHMMDDHYKTIKNEVQVLTELNASEMD